MLELLSPAGGPESVIAAVRSGADAIYLGSGSFNARRNAANFDDLALKEAVEFCHLRGVKVYLTMNTLLADGELQEAVRLAHFASEIGVDAILVQDLGVARVLRQVVPDVELHASTQMTIHSMDGVKAAADLGMTRVVLSRELSEDAIAHICAHSPVEIEVFVHGALCMCYSGQCFLSSVIGGRSGNRGLCAQPCRLQYGWGKNADKYLLSLKDMSLAQHLNELQEMGVACAKIEGRMKRPEYVAIVTRIYAAALREHRNPTKEELEQLQAAFSRQGFTDGYYQDKTGVAMFGVHEKNPLPDKLFADSRKQYQKEAQRVPVSFHTVVKEAQPVTVTAWDAEGHTASVTAPEPEAALNRPVTAGQLEIQLAKTGGTVYRCEQVTAEVEDGLSLPVSALNGLRREALEALSDQRIAPPDRRSLPFVPSEKVKNSNQPVAYTVACRLPEQITPALLSLRPESVSLELESFEWHQKECLAALEQVKEAGVIPAVTLPRILWDRETERCETLLRTLSRSGITTAYVSTLAGAELAKRCGFDHIRGDFGLGVYNSETMEELRRLGFDSAVLSFEQRKERVRDLSKPLPAELYVYGRLPLMVMENCIISQGCGQKKYACKRPCQQEKGIIDRKRTRFPVVRAYGCRNEILNAVPLFLADKPDLYERSGLTFARLRFTTEGADECVKVLERYLGQGTYTPREYTKGLYYREVE